MSSRNDQNKRIVEEKYQKFRAIQLKQVQPSSASPTKSILSKLDQNTIENDDREDHGDGFHKLLKAMPKNDKIFEVMLEDPSIYEISQNLRRESEQKNMQALMASFPERYKGLLQTEAKYKVIEKHSKERYEKQNKQMEILMEKLVRSEQKVKQQEETINQQYQKFRMNQESRYAQLNLEIRKKELELVDLKDSLERSQKKCLKMKQDYRNSNNIILELREQQQQLHKQSQRLIQKLKQCEEKLIKSHKKLLEYDNEKRIEQQSIASQYDEKIEELQHKINNLELFLEQANVRVQYKQSLLKMSEEQSDKTITKLEDEVKKKHHEIQQLRENHLEALKTIDELEQRIGGQEEQIVREAQIWVLEKQQLKRQLEKSYQANGEIKAELDAKSQLLRVLQKSMECLKTSFDSDLTNKTNQWLDTNRELSKTRKQFQLTEQKLIEVTEKSKSLESEVLKLTEVLKIKQQQALVQEQKISMAEATLRKYLDKVVQQQQLYYSLQLKVHEWMQQQQSQNLEGKTQITGMQSNIEFLQLKKKVANYEKIVSKLKDQILDLTSESKANSCRGTKIVQDLIEENKRLRKSLQEKPSSKIELFSNSN